MSPVSMVTRLLVVMFLAVLLLLPACRGVSGDREKTGGRKRVGIVYDLGGKDDKSFNSAAYAGVTRADRDFPIVLRDVEPGDPTALEPSMRA
ncbi:MAG TPA: BMP family ABC transporter substrate-binding protein, partial [Blastocatellia bacterium]|nr:BMP family ABC transporter substrate-binding protein [Blastocatellia bacterium]